MCVCACVGVGVSVCGVGFVGVWVCVYVCGGGWVCVCVEGWIWLGWFGFVRRVGMYWKEGEEKLHHHIIFVTLSSLVHEKFYPINLIFEPIVL